MIQFVPVNQPVKKTVLPGSNFLTRDLADNIQMILFQQPW